jgi:predicted secreted Zn-dependent protease
MMISTRFAIFAGASIFALGHAPEAYLQLRHANATPAQAPMRASLSGAHEKHATQVDIATSTYSVSAQSGAGLVAAMAKAGPEWKGRRHWALTEWTVEWRYNYEISSGVCRLSRSRTQLRLKYTYPLWVDEALADANLQLNWQRMVAGLIDHEEQHAKHGRHAATDIQQLMQAGVAARDCQGLGEDINRRAEKIVGDYAALDGRLDVLTRHGATTIPFFGE